MRVSKLLCPACGANLEREMISDATFCQYCGTKIVIEQHQAGIIGKVECPICGKVNSADATFRCRKCGRKYLCLNHQIGNIYLCEECQAAERAAEDIVKSRLNKWATLSMIVPLLLVPILFIFFASYVSQLEWLDNPKGEFLFFLSLGSAIGTLSAIGIGLGIAGLKSRRKTLSIIGLILSIIEILFSGILILGAFLG